MIQKLVSIFITFFILLIGLISKGIAFEEVKPSDLIMVTRDPAFSEKKDFCKALITKFTDLLDKDYDSLTPEEKDIVHQVNFLFVETKICNAYLWQDTVEVLNEIEKLPEDRISVLLSFGRCKIWECNEKDILINISEILKKMTDCKNTFSFAEEVDCIRKNYVINTEETWEGLTVFVLKQKYKDNIKLLSFKPYFTSLIYRVTPDRFLKKLENFSKNPDRPLCIFEPLFIKCPYFHLEKKFGIPRPFVQRENYFSNFEKYLRDLREGKDVITVESLEVYQTFRRGPEEEKRKEFENVLLKHPENLNYLEDEYRRIYNLPSSQDICLLKGKSVRVKNPEKFFSDYIWISVSPRRDTDGCNKLLELKTKQVFTFTKEIVQWIEKEFVSRGYLRP
ncbi:MAG: hypothetical protein QXE51_01105 [Nitrososphaeria archaeon]